MTCGEANKWTLATALQVVLYLFTCYTAASSAMSLSNHLHFPAVRATGQGSVCELCPLWRTKKRGSQLIEAESRPVKAQWQGRAGNGNRRERADLLRTHYYNSEIRSPLLLFLSLRPRLPKTPPHQESILAVSTDDPDTHRLWFWTQRSWMHRPQVDDSFAVKKKMTCK